MKNLDTSQDSKNQLALDKIRAFKSVFATEDGTTVLYDLMEKGYFLGSTLDKKGDQYATARNEGMRELVVYILHQIGRDPAKIMNFINTQKQHQEDYFETD